MVWLGRIPHRVDGEEWLGYPWTVPPLYQGSPSVCCQCPWRINTNVSSVTRSWGSLSRLSVAIASVYTASSSSPGRLVVLGPPYSRVKCKPLCPPALTLTALLDMLQHTLCSYFCSPLGVLGTWDQLLSAESSFQWLDSNVGVSESRIWPCWLILKVSFSFSLLWPVTDTLVVLFSQNAMWMHY